MFINTPKETITKIDENKKHITLCVYCDTLKKFSEKWESLGYSVNHWICDECYKKENG